MTNLSPSMFTPISHVLLDIEGTTCPVSFVSDTLFPYASAHLESFLHHHSADENVKILLRQVEQAWREDPDPEAQTILSFQVGTANVLPYLQWLIQKDRKLTALKDLQGLIWEQGYQSGALHGPLFPDVAPMLRSWRQKGLVLAVYSSGSVHAQQLIYAHSNQGDLRSLFSHWFDTNIGSKLVSSSYLRIIDTLHAEANQILFISDAIPELDAAKTAGMQIIHCDRNESNSGKRPSIESNHPVASIRSFEELIAIPTKSASH
jgi:enolase-phosphatase E1